jgi:hypothetical protein
MINMNSISLSRKIKVRKIETKNADLLFGIFRTRSTTSFLRNIWNLEPETIAEYQEYTDHPFSDSDSCDEFPVVHPQYSGYIADHICGYYDDERPECDGIESIFFYPFF